MAKENKRYYWLKLKENFFDEDTIQWLEEQKNGKEYCLFYLKLCLRSLKTNGILIRNVGTMLVPYDAKKLAEITHTDFDTVVVAMELFKKIGMVEILDNGEIYLTQLNELVGSETDKAVLMRKSRAKKIESNIVTPTLPKCYTEIELEKEKELENKNKSKSKKFTPPTVEEVKKYCEERQNNIDAEQFVDFYSSKGWKVGSNSMKDWKACVRTWERRNKTEKTEKVGANGIKLTDETDDILDGIL